MGRIFTATPFKVIKKGDFLPYPLDIKGRDYIFDLQHKTRIDWPTAKGALEGVDLSEFDINENGVVTGKGDDFFHVITCRHERWWLVNFVRPPAYEETVYNEQHYEPKSEKPERYGVSWEIDVEDCHSPTGAAVEAWEAMRREDSTACIFTVTNRDTGAVKMIDLETILCRAFEKEDAAARRGE